MKEQSMQWTDKQLETIELRDKNILVSAAAGSGKTAVLVERIKQLLLREGVPVDQILVVTFTKAAASEMKEKLIRSLNRAVSDTPEQADLLRMQLDRITRANISTFHSFALEIIRRYFHLIELDPGFKVGDEAEAKLMKADAMDRVFEDLFEADDPDFLSYVRCCASPKNENELKKSLIGLYDKIRSIPDSFQWLDRAVSQLDQTEQEFQASELMSFLHRHLAEKLHAAEESMERAASLLEEHGIDGAAALCRMDKSEIEHFRQLMKDGEFDVAREKILAFKPNTMTAPKSQKEDYAVIKEHVKGFRDRAKDIIRKELQPKFFAASLSDNLADIRGTHDKGMMLSQILKAFHVKYSEIKRQKSLLDFSDIEHFAIEILKNRSAAEEYRDKFQYIFIDEYQDSNLLQETIIDAIKRADNVFMVGDIKQSIYKFRLAEPEIFQRKYTLYKDPQTLESTKIDLNRNFRSKEPIISAVNGIFSQLMEYDRDAALHRGIPDLDFPDKPVELCIIDKAGTGSEEPDMGDSNIEEMKATELEAVYAAQIIKNALGTRIFDVKDGIERPLVKRDIVILMHGVKRKAEVFYQALQDLDIDAYVDDHAGYFDTLEIMNFSDLLRVVDNDRRDLPLLGVLRSPIFGFTTDEFIEIRTQSNETTFHGAFRSYGIRGRDSDLASKINRARRQIDQWKKESRYMPIDEFSWKLMWETGYYLYVGALQGGTIRQANLRIFVERAKSFRSGGDGSIYGLLRYMNALAEKEVETGQASIVGENDDTVRIMTIHKSKGLEFPFVLVASLGGRFINDKMEKAGVMHKDLGLGLTLCRPDEKWYRNTLLQHAILSKKRKEEQDEAVRVLYVAFTRAMDRLVLLGSVNNWEKDELKYESGSKSESNYLGMIYPHAQNAGIEIELLSRNVIQSMMKGRDSGNLMLEKQSAHKPTSNEMADTSEGEGMIQRRLSYRYANESEKAIKSKYSVSELNAVHFMKPTIEKPRFLSEKMAFTSAETGSIMHIVMQHIDPKKFHAKDYLQEYLQDLVDRELLLMKEAETVDLDLISNLANSSLGKRMAAAEILHREQAFNLIHEHLGAQVMVQGVIDCWFVEEGELVLIDYKTGRDDWRMDDRYRNQLALYREALEAVQNKPVKATYLYLFSTGQVLEVDTTMR